jgi:glycosyltransferase involved in cell wall biosynthesis
MALGLPVVSTNVGGMPFLIQDGVQGLLVPPNDVTAMSDAIIRLFEDTKLRDTLIANARHQVAQFDWHEVKGLWHAILDQKN